MKKVLIGVTSIILAICIFQIYGTFSRATNTTITLQQGYNGYTGTKDQVYMMETNNYGVGASPEFELGGAAKLCSLIYFDLTQIGIPTGAIIDSAKLSLYHEGRNYNNYGGTVVDNVSVPIYRVTDSQNKGMWREGTTTTINTYDGASFKRRDGTGSSTITEPWTTISPASTLLDSIPSSASATFTFPVENQGNRWEESSDLKDDVQGFLNGTLTNQGWFIRTSGTALVTYGFYTKENETTSLRPKLVITYHCPTSTQESTPTPTPTPTPLPVPTTVSLVFQNGFDPDGAGSLYTSNYTGSKDIGDIGYNSNPTYGKGVATSYSSMIVNGGGYLIKYDLSSIPADAVIESAVLKLTWNASTNLGLAKLYKVNDPNSLGRWEEGTGTGTTAVNGAAGKYRIYNASGTQVKWNTAGGYITDVISSAPSATYNKDTSSTSQITPTDITGMLDDVQSWVAGTSVNDGWYLKPEFAAQVYIRNNESTTVSYRPRLEISYHCPAPTPVPTPTPIPGFEIQNGVLTKYTGSDQIVTIPPNAGITSIGDGAFWGNNVITSVTIPNGVTTIGNYSFAECRSLNSVEFPQNGLTTIGYRAFSECRSLSSSSISSMPSSVTSIGGQAFFGTQIASAIIINGGTVLCYVPSNVTSYTIPVSITTIGDNAFSLCTNLTSLTIPNTITTIGKGVFTGCSSLTSIEIPSSVTSIGDSSFSLCSGLKTVTLPSNITSIGERVFSDCNSLISITIPSSVTSIGDSAFAGCENLNSITIPSSITSISDNTFFGSSRVVIHGSSGSYAQQYATNKQIPFVIS